MFPFAYAIGAVIAGAPPWLAIFIFRRDLRRRMALTGAFIGLLAVLFEPSFRDYWQPEMGFPWCMRLGDFLYGFFFGGIACAAHLAIFKKHIGAVSHTDRRKLFPLYALVGTILYVALLFLKDSSIFAALAVFLLYSAIMLALRPDLIRTAILSGLLMTVLTVAGYVVFKNAFPGIIEAWWRSEIRAGMMPLGVPIEEFIWAFALGMAIGPSQEFFTGRRIVTGRIDK